MSTSASTNWLQMAVSCAALVSSLIAVAGVVLLRRQIQHSERTLLGSTSQFCYEGMSSLLSVLVEHPHLRPYLYENAPLPSERERNDLRQQLFAIAGWYADFFDAILQQESLGNVPVAEYLHVWEGFIRNTLENSSVVRNYCLGHPTWYSPRLKELALVASEAGRDRVPQVHGDQREGTDRGARDSSETPRGETGC